MGSNREGYTRPTTPRQPMGKKPLSDPQLKQKRPPRRLYSPALMNDFDLSDLSEPENWVGVGMKRAPDRRTTLLPKKKRKMDYQTTIQSPQRSVPNPFGNSRHSLLKPSPSISPLSMSKMKATMQQRRTAGMTQQSVPNPLGNNRRSPLEPSPSFSPLSTSKMETIIQQRRIAPMTQQRIVPDSLENNRRRPLNPSVFMTKERTTARRAKPNEPDPREKMRFVESVAFHAPPLLPKRTMKMVRTPVNPRSRLPAQQTAEPWKIPTKMENAKKRIKTPVVLPKIQPSARDVYEPFWPSKKERAWMASHPLKVPLQTYNEQEMPSRPKRRARSQLGREKKIRKLVIDFKERAMPSRPESPTSCLQVGRVKTSSEEFNEQEMLRKRPATLELGPAKKMQRLH